MLNMNNEEALAVIFANSYDALIPEMVSERLMASIPFAGRYRLCDFLISSMVHSGIDNISLIVKKNYHSLMDHLGSGQEFDLARKNGGINIVPPYAQKQIKVYEGRVEAIESLKGYLRKCTQKYVIMADANYVFNFDFRELIEAHKNTGADITAMYRKQEVPKVFLRPNGNNDEMYYTFDIDDGRIKKIYINAMDMEAGYGDGENPVVLKSEFLLSLCEQLVGSGKLSAKEKSLVDRCTAKVYSDYIRSGYRGNVPTLQDFHAELLRQPEPEAADVALAIELFTEGSLNTFAKPTNVDTNSRILCYDIRDLGKQLLPVGMLVVLDSIFNRIIRNRTQGRRTWVYADEIYILFQHEYSANFLFTLWKRVRKYNASCMGITQNVSDLLQNGKHEEQY